MYGRCIILPPTFPFLLTVKGTIIQLPKEPRWEGI